MGGGSWDVGSYTSRVSAARASGKSTFDYDDNVRKGKVSGVNPLLNPTVKAGTASPFAGKIMREVCVTDEHPDPTAILVLLDVTGSNIEQARVVHTALPRLQKYLSDGGFCNDPQINVSAVGDAYSDKYPLQFGQYESDNRLDDQIAALVLEGNGGGQQRETYELGAYMAARHVHQEPYELYGKKGFVFLIGDEMPYREIPNSFEDGGRYGGFYRGSGGSRHTLESLTGDTTPEPISTKAVFDELKEKNHVFFLFQAQGAYSASQIVPEWNELLGAENVVILESPGQVVEVIAGLVARFASSLDASATESAMLSAGGDTRAVKSALKAIAKYTPPSNTGGSGVVAVADSDLDIGSAGADRL